jgi:hypothetical protein
MKLKSRGLVLMAGVGLAAFAGLVLAQAPDQGAPGGPPVGLRFVTVEAPYDFRKSEAYARLTAADRDKLEQVRRDQVLLWGALDMYADDHGGNPPTNLDELTPRYLKELPSDPFATEASAAERDLHGYSRSRNGLGYRYRRGAPGNRAWVIASVGLPEFPYLADRGNVGLYVGKGTWLSGINPATIKVDNPQPAAPAQPDEPRR